MKNMVLIFAQQIALMLHKGIKELEILPMARRVDISSFTSVRDGYMTRVTVKLNDGKIRTFRIFISEEV